MNLPGLSVRRGVTFTMLYIVLVGFGFVGLNLLPMDLFPDITFPVAAVISDYPGSGPEDVESLVTKPIEEAVSSVSGIKNVTSQSRQGVSMVMLEFDWGSDMDQAKYDIRESLDLIRDMLPGEMRDPLVVAFDPSMMPIAFLSVRGDLPTSELREIATDQIEPLVARIPGVASASTSGGLDRQIQVVADPIRMKARGVSVQQLTGAIRVENVQMPSGSIDQSSYTFAVRTQGKYTSVDQIGATIVSYAGGSPIRVRDVAQVLDTYEEQTSVTRVNGAPGVMLVVLKQSDANTVAVANRVVDELPGIREALPSGVDLTLLFEQGGFIERSLGNLASTAVLAFLMAGVVLLFFLGSFRSSVIVALSIPISIMATFFAMYAIGTTLNIISLAGLALAVGLLVDNSIVVLENAVRFMEEGQAPREASVEGPREILMAITASTLTTLSVFIPVFFVPGIAGVMFKDMAVTICVSLVVSLLVSVTLIPLLASRFLSGATFQREEGWGGTFLRLSRRLVSDLESRYSRLLDWALGHRKTVLGVSLVLFGLSAAGAVSLGGDFFSQAQEEQLMVTVERPPGTSLEAMRSTVTQVEEIIREEVPEARNYRVTYGSAEGWTALSGATSNEAQFFVDVGPMNVRERDTYEIRDALRPRMEQLAGVEVTVTAGGGMGMMGGEADLILEVYGEDQETARRLARQIAEEVRGIEGVVNVESSYERGRPEMEVRLNRGYASSLGISGAQVLSSLSTFVRGSVASYYTEGGHEYEILVRADEPYRESVSSIRDLYVATPAGTQVPMAGLVEVEPALAPVTINRKNKERMVTLSVDIEGRDLRSVTGEASKIMEEVTWPQGFRWGIDGSAQDMMESFFWLAIALLGGSVLVYMVMASQFENLLDPLIIIFTIPLALIGVVAGLLLTGTTLSVVAFIGAILLAGIVVNNGIVLVDYIEQLRHRGLDVGEAVRQGSCRRMRPVLMTALTTILAMIPLSLELGTGAELWAPMGRAVVGGMTVATLLTLLVIPVLYTLFSDLRAKFGTRKDLEEAEHLERGGAEPVA
ncbi:MAG: efflux RND transporter permease subunit [bacterium]